VAHLPHHTSRTESLSNGRKHRGATMIAGMAELNPNVTGSLQRRFKLTTQCERLFNLLMNGRKITPLESWNSLGIYRLASRIHDLRNGHMNGIPLDITGQWKKVNNQFGEECRVMEYFVTINAKTRWQLALQAKTWHNRERIE
jgi:hypothetical protein